MQQSPERKVYNFSPGPCILPKEVFEESQRDLLNWNNTGMSVMELSHRGAQFDSIQKKCRADLKTLMEIPDTHEVLLFQGGATNQYSAICQNLLGEGAVQAGNYLTTGFWSTQCIGEGAHLCEANEVANNKKHGFNDIDDVEKWNIRKDATFFHFCDNETVHGFEWNDFPWHVIPKGMLVVADMSSNFCTRAVDWPKYDVVYLGAQKNVGPSGVTFVIVKKTVLAKKPRSDIIYTSNWGLFNSAPNGYFNTPATWPIYMSGLNIAHMIKNGGIPKMAENASIRSKMIYDLLDGSDGFYKNSINKRFRSRTNIIFRVSGGDKELEQKFLKESWALGLVELSGHPAAGGGIRVSMYNAMPIEGAVKLAAFMKDFHAKNGGKAKL